MPMPNADLLALIAEVAATFVGFSLVVGLLQPDNPDAARRVHAMRAVAELAMIGGGGALLALAINSFAVSESATWRAASAVLFGIWLSLHFLAVRRFGKSGAPVFRSRFLQVAAALALLAMGLLFWNVVMPDANSGARYGVALMLALVNSAYFFVVSTFGVEVEHGESAT